MIRPCRKCGTEFDGRYCKVCAKAYRANYRKVNAQRIAAYNEANKDKVIAYKSAHYQANKEKIIARSEAWRRANPEQHKANRGAARERNAEKNRAYGAEYRAANAERINALTRVWKAANPEKVKAWNKVWRDENPELMRIYCHNRRARERDVGGRLSTGLAERLYKIQKGLCACCKEPLGDDYHLDHIMPIALGGANTDDNIQLLRQRCNNQKSAKHPVDFMREKGFLL